MDRLEKALQKAREQRETVVSGTLVMDAPAPHPAPPMAEIKTAEARTAGGATVLYTRQVAANEDEMERHRIVARLRQNRNADIFRILRTKVLQAMTQSNLTTLAVTSPHRGDGKTTVAVNLALSLALDMKQTVLLVDLDLRNPSIHKVLGIAPGAGLSDYLAGGAPIAQCLVKPSFDRLVVLPISEPLENSSEMLGSPKMAGLARELKSRYSDRIVIYDMPPLLTQDDTIAFLPQVDGVLLVMRDQATKLDDVGPCMNALSNANVLGTVLNNCAG